MRLNVTKIYVRYNIPKTFLDNKNSGEGVNTTYLYLYREVYNTSRYFNFEFTSTGDLRADNTA